MGQADKPLALVVEDDFLQRELLVTLLEESNMHALQCESAEAALKIIEEIGPNLSLIVTDVQLAGEMRGDELAKRIDAQLSDVTLLVISGRAQPELPRSARFMSKPVVPLDILREAARFR